MKKNFFIFLNIALFTCWGIEPILRSITFSNLNGFNWVASLLAYISGLSQVIFFGWIYLPLYLFFLWAVHNLTLKLNRYTPISGWHILLIGVSFSLIPCFVILFEHYLNSWEFGWKDYVRFGLTYLITGTVATWLYYLWVFKPMKKGIIQA